MNSQVRILGPWQLRECATLTKGNIRIHGGDIKRAQQSTEGKIRENRNRVWTAIPLAWLDANGLTIDHATGMIEKPREGESLFDLPIYEQYCDQKVKDAKLVEQARKKAEEAAAAARAPANGSAIQTYGSADQPTGTDVSGSKEAGKKRKNESGANGSPVKKKQKKTHDCSCHSADFQKKVNDLDDDHNIFAFHAGCRILAEVYKSDFKTCRKHTTELAEKLGLVTKDMAYGVIKDKLYLIHGYFSRSISMDDMKQKPYLYGFFYGPKLHVSKISNIDRARSFAPPDDFPVVSEQTIQERRALFPGLKFPLVT